MSVKPKKPELPKMENGAARLAPDTSLRFEIEKRAYNIWLSNGCRHGEHVSHWLQAENELFAEGRHSANKPL
jgi:hypothetical protein